MVANFDRSTRNLINSSKSNPCPVCGRTKDGDCRISHDGKMVLCHQNFEHAKTQQPDVWHFDGTSSDNRCGIYVYKEPTTKSIRPKQTRHWEYPARDGSRLVRVCREDDGEGKKKIWQERWDKDKKRWLPGLGKEEDTNKVDRASIPVYRYAEVREAIAEGKKIFFVEGESVADLLWDLGIAATTSIGGAGKYRKYGCYEQDLEGAIVILCPDRDKPGLSHMEEIAEDFPEASWIYAPPSDFYWSHLPERGGLDLADWVQGGATIEQILEAIGERRAVVDSLQRSYDREPGGNNSPARSKLKKLLNLLDTRYGSRLRLNEMTQQIELDGKDCRLDLLYLDIAEELDTDIGKEQAADIANHLAARNTYSPVRNYLNSVADAEPIDLDELAHRYLGTAEPLHAILLKKTLIAAVARAFQPGCKHDTLCIFQGDQGFFKSSFWEKLAAGFFTDNLNDANEKDEKLKLRRYWILEYAEFETAYKRKEVEQLKGFLSSRTDSLRRPYGRAIEDFPRTSIFVGTTNQREFLQDPTGERRYWVIPVKRKIPIALLEEERDRIWGEAVRLYRAGEKWWLTPEEDAQLADANQGWQASDLWESAILDYLDTRHECTVSDLLSKAIDLDLAQQGKREQMRATNIMRRHGWQKAQKQKRIGGRTQWYWERIGGGDGGGDRVVTEVVTPPNPYQATVSVKASLPVTTFSSNFSQATDSAVATDKHSCGESFGEVGSDGQFRNDETRSKQAFEGVTTSVSPPLIEPVPPAPTPYPEPETATPPEAIEPATELNESEVELIGCLKDAITQKDPEYARHIRSTLKEACKNVEVVDRAKIWGALTEAEQEEFNRLLEAPEPEQPPAPIAPTESEQQPVSEPIAPAEQAQPIDPIDAEKMRDIAGVWWIKFYPEHLQSLLNQMFGWGEPGSKYSPETIARWLEGESEEVRDRIAELLRLHLGDEACSEDSADSAAEIADFVARIHKILDRKDGEAARRAVRWLSFHNLKDAVKAQLSPADNEAFRVLYNSIAQPAKPEIAEPIAPAESDGCDIDRGF